MKIKIYRKHNLHIILILVLLSYCSSQKKYQEIEPQSVVTLSDDKSLDTPSKQNKTIEDLERLEMKSPQDAGLKLELAHLYWCQNKKSFAVENWLWLRQFAALSPEAKIASERLKLLHEKRVEELNTAENCANSLEK